MTGWDSRYILWMVTWSIKFWNKKIEMRLFQKARAWFEIWNFSALDSSRYPPKETNDQFFPIFMLCHWLTSQEEFNIIWWQVFKSYQRSLLRLLWVYLYVCLFVLEVLDPSFCTQEHIHRWILQQFIFMHGFFAYFFE
jgi:hypothetical protein